MVKLSNLKCVTLTTSVKSVMTLMTHYIGVHVVIVLQVSKWNRRIN